MQRYRKLAAAALAAAMLCSFGAPVRAAGEVTAPAQPLDTATPETAVISDVLQADTATPETADTIQQTAVPAAASFSAVLPNAAQPQSGAEGGTTYYVDADGGDDENDGTSPQTAFQTLDKLNSMTFAPGDTILFQRGDEWMGQFRPKGSGAEGTPITVSSYGEGDERPVLNGAVEDAVADQIHQPNSDVVRDIYSTVYLENVEYWEITGLEIMNDDDVTTEYAGDKWRAGIRVVINVDTLPGDYDGVTSHIHIRDNYIHNIDGMHEHTDVTHNSLDKEAGGITVQVIADTLKDKNSYTLKARFDDLRIEQNHFKDVSVLGVRAITHYVFANDADFYITGLTRDEQWSTNVYIGHNLMENMWVDGIIVRASTAPLVEYNTVLDFEQVKGGVGIWNTVTHDAVIQYNEVAYGHEIPGKSGDGCAFDIDSYSYDTTYQYNYSHDILYGHLMFMGGTQGSVVRYNISEDDGCFIRHSSSAGSTAQVYNNTYYYDGATDKPLSSNVGDRYEFKNNIFYNYSDTTPTSWTDVAAGSSFSNNIFYEASGQHSDTEPYDLFAIYSDPGLTAPGTGEERILGAGSLGTVSAQTLAGYQLRADSPAIDRGVAVEGADRDFWGNEIQGQTDIGAHEFQGESNPGPAEYAYLLDPAMMKWSADSTPEHPISNAADLDSMTWWQATASEAAVTIELPSGTQVNTLLYQPAASAEETSRATTYEIWGKITGEDTYTLLLKGGWADDVTQKQAVFPAGTYDSLKLKLSAGSAPAAAGLYWGFDETQPLTPAATPEGDGVFPATADAYVHSGTSTGGSEPFLKVKRATGTDSYTRQAYLQFDLGARTVTEDERVILYMLAAKTDSASGSAALQLHAVSDTSWKEGSIVWADRPVMGDAISEKIPVSESFQWVWADVTEYLQDKTGKISIGVKETENRVCDIYAKEYADGMYSAYLLVTSADKPTASQVSVEGKALAGTALQAVYEYDGHGLPEGETQITWYVSASQDGSDPVTVGYGRNYTVTPMDCEGWLYVEVVPVDVTGAQGEASRSIPLKPEMPENSRVATAADDGFARGGANADQNYNDSEYLEVKRAKDGNATYERYAFLKFDLPDGNIPENAKVLLYLYGAKTDTAGDAADVPFDARVYGAGTQWSSDTLTGATMPEKTGSYMTASFGLKQGQYTWQAVDVTELVRQMTPENGEISFGITGDTHVLGKLGRAVSDQGARLMIVEETSAPPVEPDEPEEEPAPPVESDEPGKEPTPPASGTGSDAADNSGTPIRQESAPKEEAAPAEVFGADIPQTGDPFPVAILVAFAAVSAFGLAVLFLCRKCHDR